MGAKELNELLLNNFPNLKSAFKRETDWQEGIETGSIIVFEDVFYKYIKRNINNENISKKCFNFFKYLLTLNDNYVTDVIKVSIIENIISLSKKEKYIKYFDEEMKNIANDIGKNYFYNWRDIC